MSRHAAAAVLALALLPLAACESSSGGSGDPADTAAADTAAAADASGDAAPPGDAAGDAASPADDAAGPGEDADAAPAPAACEGDDGGAATLLVPPYLQDVEPTSAWVLWETDPADGSRVEWGETEALGEVSCGRVVGLWEFLGLPDDPAEVFSSVHEVQLTGLAPATRYHYRVVTGATASEVRHFVTPPEHGDEGAFALVAFGDGQRDDSRPDKWREVVQDGAMAFARETYGEDLAEALAMVIYAGDLVDSGWSEEDWQQEFFPPAAELLGQVPFYPVPGNHEGNSPYFWRYFHLPANGTPGLLEHWWYKDRGNLRLIGLDSNDGFRSVDQLDWLDVLLEDTCEAEGVDFVFAQLHHPHRSEVWTPGEIDFTGEVIRRLEDFSTACGKPTIHFFGHTHAYSRGQSRDHAHLMVNVSSAGGALDRWGEQKQADYEEFSVSTDDYGFVVVDVEGGDDPSFRLRRVSRGVPEAPLDNAVTDEVRVRRYNAPPATPTPVATEGLDACAGPVRLVADDFSDPEGDAHYASRWQIAATCDGLDAPTWDRWLQAENRYMGEDTQAGDDLRDADAGVLAPGAWCWRVRYRDASLGWSAWSTPQPFTVPDCR